MTTKLTEGDYYVCHCGARLMAQGVYGGAGAEPKVILPRHFCEAETQDVGDVVAPTKE